MLPSPAPDVAFPVTPAPLPVTPPTLVEPPELVEPLEPLELVEPPGSPEVESLLQPTIKVTSPNSAARRLSLMAALYHEVGR